jgi:hypothetical protein
LGISCLAKGAYQIFARVVLALAASCSGAARTAYRERVAPDNRASFDRLSYGDQEASIAVIVW